MVLLHEFRRLFLRVDEPPRDLGVLATHDGDRLRVHLDRRRQRGPPLPEDPAADIRLRGEEHGRAGGRVRIECGFDRRQLPRDVRLLREQQDARWAIDFRRDRREQREELVGHLLADAPPDAREELDEPDVAAVRRDTFDQLVGEHLGPAPDIRHDLRRGDIDAVRRLEGPQQPAIGHGCAVGDARREIRRVLLRCDRDDVGSRYGGGFDGAEQFGARDDRDRADGDANRLTVDREQRLDRPRPDIGSMLRVGAQRVGDRGIGGRGGDGKLATPLATVDEMEAVGDHLHHERVRPDARLRPDDLRVQHARDRFLRQADDELEVVVGDHGVGRFHARAYDSRGGSASAPGAAPVRGRGRLRAHRRLRVHWWRLGRHRRRFRTHRRGGRRGLDGRRRRRGRR